MTEKKELKEELKTTESEKAVPFNEAQTIRRKPRKEVVRHDKNPFIDERGQGLDIPVGKKGVRLTTTGKNNENVLMNLGTGETAMTNVIAYKKVDTEKFIKLFTSNVALTFDLNGAGIKALMVLAWSLQNQTINKDVVPLDKYGFNAFVDAHPSLKYTWRTLQRGITELVDAGIIARHTRPGYFFINPYFIFNGNRIAFTNVIERDTSQDHGQKDLLQ